MADKSFLHWPFFENRHRDLAQALDLWAAENLGAVAHTDTDATCRQLVAMLGAVASAAVGLVSTGDGAAVAIPVTPWTSLLAGFVMDIVATKVIGLVAKRSAGS